MNRSSRHVLCALLALLSLPACEQYEPLTVANARRIKVCQSTKSDVQRRFGPPDSVGLVAGMTVWTYRDNAVTGNSNSQMRVLFDPETRKVVDVVFNPEGTVRLENRCQ